MLICLAGRCDRTGLQVYLGPAQRAPAATPRGTLAAQLPSCCGLFSMCSSVMLFVSGPSRWPPKVAQRVLLSSIAELRL